MKSPHKMQRISIEYPSQVRFADVQEAKAKEAKV
jgi:hypothetical protein